MAKKQSFMNTKQALKLVTIGLLIIAITGVFIGKAVKFNTFTFSLYELAFHQTGFSIFPFICIIFIVSALVISVISLYKDDNKILPLVILGLTLIAGIIALCCLPAQAVAIKSTQAKRTWNREASIDSGAILVGITLLLAMIACAINSFRMWILKKNN